MLMERAKHSFLLCPILLSCFVTNKICLNQSYALINSITERRDRAMLLMFYKVVNNLVPDYLSHLLPNVNRNMVKYDRRNNDEINLPFIRLETFQRSFIPYALKLWNLLSVRIVQYLAWTNLKVLYKRSLTLIQRFCITMGSDGLMGTMQGCEFGVAD